jgi:hypothetical protein
MAGTQRVIGCLTNEEFVDMAGELGASSDWTADDQSVLFATLSATPAQRIAWLEEALHIAYASGALRPRRPISKEEWESKGVRADEG